MEPDFEQILLQGESFTITGAGAGESTYARTETQNQERQGQDYQNNTGGSDAPNLSANDLSSGNYNEFGLRPGYSGSGYLDINGTDTGAQAEATFDADAGDYQLTIRYGNGGTGSSSNRPISLEIDGVEIAAIADTNTGGWTSWGEATFAFTLPTGGAHTLTILQSTPQQAPNIDAVAIHAVGVAADFFPAPDLPEPTIEQIVLDATDGEIQAGAATFHRDQIDILNAIAANDAATLSAEREGAPNGFQGGNLSQPLDAYGLRDGYTGLGYTDFNGGGADEVVTYDVTVVEAGLYDLTIRYASTANVNDLRPLDIAVAETGFAIAAEPFPGQGFETWIEKTVSIELAAGANSVTLSIPSGLSNGPNIDAVALTTVGETADFSSNLSPVSPTIDQIVVQAEDATITLAASDATFTKAVTAETIPAGETFQPNATGEGYVDYGDDAGDAITVEVDVAEAGIYGVHVRYATSSTRPLDLGVNGSVLAPLQFTNTDFDGSGGLSPFEQWGVLSTSADLQAGVNTISLAIPTGATTGPNVDAIAVTTYGVAPDFFAAPVNAAPSVLDGAATTDEDVAVAIDVADLVSDDADADADLTIAAEATGGDVTVDGTVITFTPDDEFSGDATITYRATDTENATSEDATIAVTVAAVDDAPTAIALTALPVDENVAGAVLADVAVTDVDTTYAAADLALGGPDAALFELIDGPTGVQLKLADGVALDFEAPTQPTVSVSIVGVEGISEDFTPAPADVDETVNAAPSVLDSAATTDEDVAVAIDVADLVSDDADADADLTIAAEATGGDVTVDGTVITFTPDDEFSGDATITYRATDTENATSEDATIAVTVAAVDDAPTAIALTALPVDENVAGAVLADVAVTDVDTTYAAADLALGGPDAALFELIDGPTGVQLKLADGVALDFEAPTQPTVSVSIVGVEGISEDFTPAPADVVENAPVQVLFDAATLASYSSQDRPEQGGAGVTVSEDQTSLTLDGNLWKRAPLSEAYDVTEATILTVDLAVGETVPEIVAVGYDADDNPFNANPAVFQLDGTQSQTIFADMRGEGVDLGDGVVRFVLDLSAIADTTITSLVFVSDDDLASNGFGQTTFLSATLSESAGDDNAAPRVVGGGVADVSAAEGDTIEIDLAFADDDGDPLSFDVAATGPTGAPVSLTALGLSLDGPTLSGDLATDLPAGVYTFVATADDGSATATDVFTITIEAENEAPVTDPGAAFEPFVGQVGQAIAPIDLASFASAFSDPDGDALTLSARDLPAGLSVNEEGVLVGAPLEPGDGSFTVVATDPEGLEATLDVALILTAPPLGDTTVIEAEDFTGLGDGENFFATGQAGASGGDLIRVGVGQSGSVQTSPTAQGVVAGWHLIAIDVYDETDGTATFSLSIDDAVLATDETFDDNGAFLNTETRGAAGQEGNRKRIEFDTPVFVDADSVLTFSGQADGELLRLDAVRFTLTEEPNAAPESVEIDATVVAENADGAAVGAVAVVDPDGPTGDVALTVDDGRFEIVDGVLKLVDGVALDFEDEPTVPLTLTATDDSGSASASITVSVTDENDAPTLVDGATLDDVSLTSGTEQRIDLSGLGAADEDAGDDPVYVVAGANGAVLPDGFAIDGDELIVPAGAPAGVYEIEIFATDGAASTPAVGFTLTVADPTPFTPFALQAEDAALTVLDDGSNTTITTVRDPSNPEPNDSLPNGLRPDFSGTGYVDFGDTPGDAVTFTVSVPASGSYDLNVRYASNTGRPLDLSVNGVAPSALPFASTDPDGAGGQEGFDVWAFETVTIDLVAGDNTVALAIPPGANTGPNIDRIEITEAGSGPIVVDDTADEDGDFAVVSELATAPAEALDAVEFRLSGVDDDIVRFEVSLDQGETFSEVVAVADGDDFIVTLDLTGELPATTISPVFRLVDDVDNVVSTSATIAVGDAPFSFELQLESRDGSVTIIDDTGDGEGDQDSTQFRDAQNPEGVTADRPEGLWVGFTGDGYLDMGGNAGDAAAFDVDVPADGEYVLSFRYGMGSNNNAERPMVVSAANADGDPIDSETVPFANTGEWFNWQEQTVTLTLEAGVNTITLTNTIDNGPNIDRVVVTAATPDIVAEPGPRDTIRINFQDAGTAVPDGYLADTFEGFGDRGNGLTYGWVTEASATDADGTVNTPIDGSAYPAIAINERSGGVFDTYDPRLTGYAHFDLSSYPGDQSDPDFRVAWEIELENGWYEVAVAVGDTGGPNDSDNKLELEGELIADFVPTDENKSILVTKTVEVTDGRLTLAAPQGTITEIQYVDIRGLPDLTPDDAREAPADYASFLEPVAVAGVGADRVEVDLDPASGVAVDVAPDSDFTIGLQVVANRDVDGVTVTEETSQDLGRAGVSLDSLNGGAIRLFETLTGEEVAFSANTSGGNDTVTLSPTADLKENTSYTIVIDGATDLGENDGSSETPREFQKFSTTFVTGGAREVVAREVAFVETVELDGAADGLFVVSSITLSPDQQFLYATTLSGTVERWAINADGSLDDASRQTVTVLNDADFFQDPDGARALIGIEFDPNDPNVIWVTDNYPVPLSGRSASVPEFSGRVAKLTLQDGDDFDVVAQEVVTGLPRSAGDHLTNSITFRPNVDFDENDPASGPSHYLYLTQGANTAIGGADPAWESRPERLMSAAVIEIDPTVDVSGGPIDVSSEPIPNNGQNLRFRFEDGNQQTRDLDEDFKEGPIQIPVDEYDAGGPDAELNGQWLHFDADGVATVRVSDDPTSDIVREYYDPFAADAPVTLYATGIRNAYDIVAHSNGQLYLPSNGTAAGGITPDDPSTPEDERLTNVSKQDDYLFVLQEGGYYGSPNPVRDEYIAFAGNPTAGQTPGSLEVEPEGGRNGYPVGTAPDPNFDGANSYSLSENRSPNGSVEYKSDAFGPSLQGYLLVTEYSQGNDVIAIPIGADGTPDVEARFALQAPDGTVLTWDDPLDIIEGPNGVLYLSTLDRDSGQSQIVRLTPAPGGQVGDTTADEGGDLALTIVDDADPTAVAFAVTGLDADIVALTVSVDGGAPSTIVLDAANGFTLDLSGVAAGAPIVLGVTDDDGNTASAAATFGGDAGDGVFIDATTFTVLDTDGGTLIRNINDPSTYENPNSNNDLNGDGLNDGYDGLGYLDPNGGAEDKAAFTIDAPAAGTYTLAFRMANGGGGATPQARPIAIKTDDETVQITNTNTGSFTNWQIFNVVLTLDAGPNLITIEQLAGQGAPNIDSVTLTPLDVEDTDADVGDDLAISVVDASDASEVVFDVSGADDDIVSFSVSVDGGATDIPATPGPDGQFTLDLTAFADQEIDAILTVVDDAGNVAQATSAPFTPDAVDPAPNDGEELIDGVLYTLYEAESATLDGADIVTTAEDDRGAQGGGFVDFIGDVDQTITWTIAVPEDGSYSLDILYALAASKAARPMDLLIDGVLVETLPFAPNSNQDETIWGAQSTSVDLTAGVSTVTVVAPGGNGPNVDQLRITSAPVGDVDADEGDDLALTVVDSTDATAVVFQVDGLDDDIVALEVSVNGGPAQPVTLDADGQFILDVGLTLGDVDAALTVTDAADNTATAAAETFFVAPDLDPDAGVAIVSDDAAFFADRLHFSWIDDPSEGGQGDRDFKSTATATISNTGSAPLEIFQATIDGPFALTDPDALDGLVLQPGQSVQVEVAFDRAAYTPPTGARNAVDNGQEVIEGGLSVRTNAADDPLVTLDLSAWWQPEPEAGFEPNVNEVWELFGFGNEIEGLSTFRGGENSVLSTNDVFAATDETEVLSPYWRLADGVSEAKITQLAAFHGPGGASLGIHGPGDKSASNDENFGSHQGADNQRILPDGPGIGGAQSFAFGADDIPNGWAGADLFGIEVAGLSTDPTLNPTGGVTVPGAQQGHTVKMLQALDADGNEIPNTYLVMMDYTGINYDYNDNLYVIEGIAPAFFGEVLDVTGLDEAAADDRLVFTNIEQPVGGQEFRNEATFELTNSGIADLTIDAITLGGDLPGAFAIVDAPADGASLAPGATATVTIAFNGVDGVDDGAAVLQEAALLVETSAGDREIALAGLAQLQSESGEEPTVAQIVEAFGYGTDVAQGALNNGGAVEAVGDEVLNPYWQALDPSADVVVTQMAAFLQQGDVARLSTHNLQGTQIVERFAQDDQQGQTVSPDGFVDGPGDTGAVASDAFDGSTPFGFYIAVDGKPTFASWSDPALNVEDPALEGLGGLGDGHLIRAFEAKDADGATIPGAYIVIQDYAGAGNFDYNDHIFLVTNVQPYVPAGADDLNGDDVNDAAQLDADGDGLVDFFDDDDDPTPSQTPFPGPDAPTFVDGALTVLAADYDDGGQGVAYNDTPGLQGGSNGGRPGSAVEITTGGAVGWIDLGEWLEYTIDVPAAGAYDLSLLSALGTSAGAQRTATVTFDAGGGVYATAVVEIDPTGAWTTFESFDGGEVALLEGEQVVRVTFNGGSQDLLSFTLEATSVDQNQAPIAEPLDDQSGTAGVAIDIAVASAFTDPDGDALTLSADGLPDGLTLVGGAIVGTTTATGVFTVTVTASDGLASDSSSFDLTIAPPVQGDQTPFPGPNAPTFVDGALTVDATNFDDGGQGVAYNDSPGKDGGGAAGRGAVDVEFTGAQDDIGFIEPGEWVEYTIDVPAAGDYALSVVAKTPIAGNSIAVSLDDGPTLATFALPDANGAADDGFGGTDFAPSPPQTIALAAGVQTLRFTFDGELADNGYILDFRSFTLEATADENQAPVTTGIADQTEVEGAALSIDVASAFSDPDGDGLTFTIVGLPAGLSPDGGSIVGTPTETGVFTVTVTADDGEVSTPTSFDLTIAPAVDENEAPVTTGIADQTEVAGSAVDIDVASAFSDPDGDGLTFTIVGLPAGLSPDGGSIVGTPTETGVFTVTVTADDGQESVDTAFQLTVSPPPSDGQSPFPGPAAPTFVDGALSVLAFNYDFGGQGVAYNDDAGLAGGSDGGRTGSDVEIAPTGAVGWIAGGDWLEYTIDVPTAGVYALDVFGAVGFDVGQSTTVSVTFDDGSGVYESATADVDFTGSWSVFEAFDGGAVALQAGEQVVRVTFETGFLNFQSFALTPDGQAIDDGQNPFPGPDPAAFVDGLLSLAASDYDDGGQGVAYNDAPGLSGGTDGGRDGSNVEIASTGAVGWIGGGEWLEYTIDVPEDGSYALELISSVGFDSGTSSSVFVTFDNGASVYQDAEVDVDFTGGWDVFQAFDGGSVDLEAGEQVVRVTFGTGSLDFLSFSLTAEEEALDAEFGLLSAASSVDDGEVLTTGAPTANSVETIDAAPEDAGGVEPIEEIAGLDTPDAPEVGPSPQPDAEPAGGAEPVGKDIASAFDETDDVFTI